MKISENTNRLIFLSNKQDWLFFLIFKSHAGFKVTVLQVFSKISTKKHDLIHHLHGGEKETIKGKFNLQSLVNSGGGLQSSDDAEKLMDRY